MFKCLTELCVHVVQFVCHVKHGINDLFLSLMARSSLVQRVGLVTSLRCSLRPNFCR